MEIINGQHQKPDACKAAEKRAQEHCELDPTCTKFGTDSCNYAECPHKIQPNHPAVLGETVMKIQSLELPPYLAPVDRFEITRTINQALSEQDAHTRREIAKQIRAISKECGDLKTFDTAVLELAKELEGDKSRYPQEGHIWNKIKLPEPPDV